jgi:hypothetical protein
MVRVLTVVFCAMAFASGGCTTRSIMISQSESSKKATAFKKSIKSKSRTLVSLPAASLISQTASSKKATESDKFTESKYRVPIPLPEAPLLSPQPEPSCEVETTGTNADERQKLDYERQCYRHAEMIVRNRLQLLQDSVDKTISAIQRSERGGP